MEAEYGLTGFAVVVKLFQRIYGGEGYYCEWTREVALLFAKSVGLGGSVVSEILEASIKRGIFDSDLFEKYHILTSKGIQQRYFEAVSRRKEIRVKGAYLLVNVGLVCKNVNIIEENVNINRKNVHRSRQSRVEKRRVEESRVTIYSGGGDDVRADQNAAAVENTVEKSPPGYLQKIDNYLGATPALKTELMDFVRPMFLKYFGRVATEADLETAFDYLRGEPVETDKPGVYLLTMPGNKKSLLELAFAAAMNAGKPNWNYVAGVIKQFDARGINSAEAYEDYERERG